MSLTASLDLAPWREARNTLIGGLSPQRIGEVMGRRMALTYLPQLFRKGGDPPWPKPKYRDGQPLRDTGRLGGSFVYSITSTGAEIYTNVIYAGPQHRGDLVRPKKAKFLAIPLSTLTISERRTKGPRDFQDTFVWRSPASGKAFIVQTKGKGKREKFRFLFILVKSVQLPPRPFMEWSQAAIDDSLKTLSGLIGWSK